MMITGKELRDVLLRSPYAVLFVGVYLAAAVVLGLYFGGVTSVSSIAWIPFATIGILLLGAGMVLRRRRHDAPRR